jgi:hypothetical protein
LELEGWKESLSFYKEEILRSSDWLQSIVRLNTVPDLGIRVKKYFSAYERIQGEIESVLIKITKMSTGLEEEEGMQNEGMVHETLIREQHELRGSMQELEKKYIGLKYDCDQFVADTLIIQQHRS